MSKEKIVYIDPCRITRTPDSRISSDDRDISLLADSITLYGILNPLLVREIGKGNYSLISGARRLTAARMAHLKTVPCIVKRVDGFTACFMAATENLQRKELSFFEKARIYERLSLNLGVTVEDVSLRLNKSAESITEKIKLLRLSDSQKDGIIRAGLTEKHAKLLLKVPSEKRCEVLRQMVAEELGVKQSEGLVNEILFPKPKPTFLRKTVISDTRLFDNSIKNIAKSAQNAGYTTELTTNESTTETEYTIRISKFPNKEYIQIPIA